MPSIPSSIRFVNNMSWRAKAFAFLVGAAVVFVGLVVASQQVVVLPRIQSAEFAYYGRIGEEITKKIASRQQALANLAELLAARPDVGAPSDEDLRRAMPNDAGDSFDGLLRPVFIAVYDGGTPTKLAWRSPGVANISRSVFLPVVGESSAQSGTGVFSTAVGMLLYAKTPYQGGAAGTGRGVLVVAELMRKPPTGDVLDLGPIRSAFIEPGEMARRLPNAAAITGDCEVAPDGDTTMVTRVALRDDFGRIVGGVEIRSERLVRLVQITSMRLTTAVMLIATVIMSLVIWILIERIYVRRIERLIDLAGRLDEEKTIEALVNFSGSDEVGRLARTTGHMVRTLNEARELAVVADTAKMNFLAMMSHELRTPMNGVIGFAGLLRETAANAEQLEYIRIIESSGRTILKQIDEILHYAMISQGGLNLDEKPVKIRELIAEVAKSMESEIQKKKLSYFERVDESVPRILWADHDRVGQILNNLISNAVKFTSTGGISVEVSAVVEESSEERQLKIEVSDTGIGITSEHQTRLFRPFSQAESGMNRRFGGAGLGLAIAHRLAQAMGGSISVVSEVGRGSVFTVLLPLKEAESIPAPRVTISGDLGSR